MDSIDFYDHGTEVKVIIREYAGDALHCPVFICC